MEIIKEDFDDAYCIGRDEYGYGLKWWYCKDCDSLLYLSKGIYDGEEFWSDNDDFRHFFIVKCHRCGKEFEFEMDQLLINEEDVGIM